MAAVASTMRALGSDLPEFELIDATTGGIVRSGDLPQAPATVVAFICNHCPFVKHLRLGLADLGRYCAEREVPIVAISSNDVDRFPQDGPALMAKEAEDAGYVFPYLYDDTQAVARAFDAACTPDFFVFDREGHLAYRGQFDGSRPGNGVAVSGADVRAAIDALVDGRAPNADQKPSIGCNIKWKP